MRYCLLAAAILIATVSRSEEYRMRESLDTMPAGTATADWQAELVEGRLAPGQRRVAEQALLVRAGEMRWDVADGDGPGFVEVFLMPEAWSGNSTEGIDLLRLGVGDATYTVGKAAGAAMLELRRGDTVCQRYPIYNWQDEPWQKQHPEGRWHYLNVAITPTAVALRVDGFPALAAAPAAGGLLRQVTLAGGPGTVWSWLHAVGGTPPDGDALRGRFRALYRGLPDLHANTVTIPRTAAPPRVDGTIEPGEWARAARLSGFTSRKGGVRAEDLRVDACYDDKYVYLLFRTPFTGDLRTKRHEGWDAPLWGEESYEIFLHPPFAGVPIYVQLVGNPSGNQADLQVMNMDWNGRWDWQPAVHDGEWIAEFRADFRGIDAMPPGDGARWTGNFLNTFADAQWSKTQRYHDTGAFGVLHFAADTPIIRPGHMQVSETSATVPLVILASGRPRELVVALQVYGPGEVLPHAGQEEHLSLEADETRELTLRVPRDGLASGTLAVYVREGEKERFYHQVDFPAVPPVVRTGWPAEAQENAARKAVAEGNDDQELTDEEKAYRRQWTDEELGKTLKDSAKWMHNTIGLGDPVVAPWTPMTVTDTTVGCWGRQMVYDHSLLPTQIASDAVPLLCRPPRLVLMSNGREQVLGPAEVTVEQLGEGKIRVHAEASGGPFAVTTDTLWEFDGMGWIELSVRCPEGPAPVDAAYLEIPLRADRAELYHVMVQGQGHAPNTTSDAMPDEGLTLDTFRHLLWFGDDRRGLCWFAEGMENWQITNEDAIQTVGPERDGERLLRLKLADHAFTVDRPWKLAFGLQATPMRPRSEDFRFRANREKASVWCWFWGDGDYYPFQSTCIDKAREQIERQRAAGREVMPCSSLTYFGKYRMDKAYLGALDHPGMEHPEILIWGKQWEADGDHIELAGLPERHTAPDGWYGKKYQPTGLVRLSPASPWQDFYIWKLDQLVRDTGLGAIYLDQNLWGSEQRDHGCGYVDYRGEWTASWPVRSWRQMVQRISRVFTDAHGRSLIRWHSSNQIAPPILSFVDVVWDGENYAHGQHKVFEFYSRVLPPGRLQAQHTGLQFGWAADLLPELEARYAPAPASERDMVGWFGVHDGGVDAAHTVQIHMVRWLRDQLATAIGEPVSTHYYWEADNPIQVADREVYHITYRHADGGFAVLVFNRRDEPVIATLELRAGGPLAATDVLSTAAIGTGQTWTLPLQPRDFRLLALQPPATEN